MAGKRVRLGPADLAFYALMVRATVTGKFINYETPGLLRKYLREYLKLTDEYRDFGKRERVLRRIVTLRKALTRFGRADRSREVRDDELAPYGRRLSQDWFSERKAKVNRAIQKALGDLDGGIYMVVALGKSEPKIRAGGGKKRPKSVFGLGIDSSRIRILGPEEE